MENLDCYPAINQVKTLAVCRPSKHQNPGVTDCQSSVAAPRSSLRDRKTEKNRETERQRQRDRETETKRDRDSDRVSLGQKQTETER